MKPSAHFLVQEQKLWQSGYMTIVRGTMKHPNNSFNTAPLRSARTGRLQRPTQTLEITNP